MNTSSKEKRTAVMLIALIAILLVGSVAMLLQYSSHNSTTAPLIADIYQNGILIESISLDKIEEPYTITLTGTDNCTNIIEVRNGSIGIISADCPDKLCVKQGFMDSSLLPITCLPNRVVIQLRTNDGNEDINVY